MQDFWIPPKACGIWRPFIRHHHEWWNGNGYPNGLDGEQIPLEARILAVCDAVEAMASDRAYHLAMSLDEIIAELKRCAKTQFDSQVIDAFVRVTEQQGTRLVINSARDIVDRRQRESGAVQENSSPEPARRLGSFPGVKQ